MATLQVEHGDEKAAIVLRKASTKDDFAEFRKLAIEFHDWLQFDLSWQNFGKEMDNLPHPYGEPEGFIILAMLNDELAGCVALKPLPSAIDVHERNMKVCEMKRLFVRESAQGRGVGRELIEKCIAWGKELHYDLMVLDTIPRLEAANSLYQKFGFTPRGAYYGNPVEGVIYYELSLTE